MNVESGSFSEGATGNHQIVLNGSFTPLYIQFECGPRSATNETLVTRSSGWTDGNIECAISIFDDGTLRLTRESGSYCITHYKNVSGTPTKVLSGSIVSFDAGGAFTIDMDVVDSSYPIRFTAFG